MNKNDNIMDSLNRCPFKLPAGYTDKVEESVRKKIEKEETGNMALLKPNFALLLTFVAILGIGYGIMNWVTPKDYTGVANETENSAVAANENYGNELFDTIPDNRLSSEEEAIEDYLIETGFTVTALASIE